MSGERGLFFLHIPKAAGTTLRGIIRRHYDPRAIYEVRAGEPVSIGDAERPRIRLLMGHADFGAQQHLAVPTDTITMLREPVDRIVSAFFYVRTRPSRVFAGAASGTLDDFVRSGHPQTMNAQTRQIAGVDGEVDAAVLALAKRNLEHEMIAFGLHERFDESIWLFKRALGWRSLYYRRMNITPERLPLTAVNEETRREIARRNAFDVELYAFAASLFESRFTDAGPELAKRVRRFQTVNGVYSQLSRAAHAIAVPFPPSVRQWIRAQVNRLHLGGSARER